jgi:hypothetical protein
MSAAIAGCGSSGSSGSKVTSSTSPVTAASTAAPPASAASSTTAGSGGASAKTIALIEADWAAFFSAKTPVARRVELLENGQEFASIIKAQADSTLAAGATAKVTKVMDVSPTRAKVVYQILFNGAVALKNQPGVAVYQGGLWKVGDTSFCGLLKLENAGKSTSLPATCSASR